MTTQPPTPPLTLAQIDEKLGILREGWLDAPEDKKQKWMARINAALDQRLSINSNQTKHEKQ